MIYGHEPDFDVLCIFGCLCFANNQKSKGNKFAPRSRSCVFMGYSSGKKGWKLYDLENIVFFVFRDVRFYEIEFPFANFTPHTDVAPNGFLGIDLVFLDDLESILVDDGGCAGPTIALGPLLPSASHPTSPSCVGTLDVGHALETPVANTLGAEPSPPTHADPTPGAEPSPLPSVEPLLGDAPNTSSVSFEPSSSLGPAESCDSSSFGSLVSLGLGHRSKRPSTLLRNFVTHSVRKNKSIT